MLDIVYTGKLELDTNRTFLNSVYLPLRLDTVYKLELYTRFEAQCSLALRLDVVQVHRNQIFISLKGFISGTGWSVRTFVHYTPLYPSLAQP